MKSEPSPFYIVLGINLLIQFLGTLAAMLVTDMGRTLSIWVIACMGHWSCFALVVILCRKRPFKEIGTIFLSVGGLLFLSLFLLLAVL